jgi:hypothetical protein
MSQQVQINANSAPATDPNVRVNWFDPNPVNTAFDSSMDKASAVLKTNLQALAPGAVDCVAQTCSDGLKAKVVAHITSPAIVAVANGSIDVCTVSTKEFAKECTQQIIPVVVDKTSELSKRKAHEIIKDIAEGGSTMSFFAWLKSKLWKTIS